MTPAVATAAALSAVIAGPAHAATRDWINAGGSDFIIPFNWSSLAVPGPSDTARFNLNAAYEVDFTTSPTSDALEVRHGVVTFDMNGETYTLDGSGFGVVVGADASENAQLLLKGPGGELAVDSAAVIGHHSGATGKVTVGNNVDLTTVGSLYVGLVGNGELVINTGGLVDNARAYVGDLSAGRGKVTVSQGTWTGLTELVVGHNGDGELTVNSGGAVSSTFGDLGRNSGATGRVTINNGGTWTNTNLFNVGGSGDGELTINGGGAVFSGLAKLGASGTSSSGTVNVSGGTWTGSDQLIVGNAGTGVMNINGGGHVTNTVGQIGGNANSNGSVTVTGGTWTNTSNLLVGNGGSGQLAINTGAAVTNTMGIIGDNAGSTGKVTVAGGTWTNTSSLIVGNAGAGELILNSGKVMNTSSSLGNQLGGTGKATVNGGTWTNSTDLRVGNAGHGELVINTGGQVSNTVGFIGDDAGSTGKVTVNGGTWTNSVDLRVGNAGHGELVINSGQVNSVSTRVGAGEGATGTVTVNGGTWKNSSNMSIGFSLGMGSLTINPGGRVDISSFLAVGNGTRSMGKITVNGGMLNSSSSLEVGLFGDGELSIIGGQVTSMSAVIGSQFTSTGVVTVDGGTWTNLSNLIVGFAGPGDLKILNGGVVQVAQDANLGEAAAGMGAVVVENPGSRWEITDDLNIGGNDTAAGGSGEVTIGTGTTVDVGGVTRVWNAGTLFLDGGTLRTGSLIDNGGTLLLHKGHLEFTAPLIVGPTGLIGDTLNIGPGLTVAVSNPHTHIESGGQLLVSGATASFTAVGTTGQNDGVISVVSGTLTYTDQLVQNGILSTINATVNGSVHNLAAGDVVVSGVTTFNEIDPADTFVNDGQVHVAGTAIFNIDVSGPGDFSQSGTTIFNKSFNPGSSPGHVEFEGDLQLGPDAQFTLELAGLERGLSYDAVDVAGSFTADGTFTLQLLDGFTPHRGDTFDLLDFDAASGQFKKLLLPQLHHGMTFDTSSLLTTGSISVVPEPGTAGLLAVMTALSGLAARPHTRRRR